MQEQILEPGDIIWFDGTIQAVLKRNRTTYSLVPVVNFSRQGYRPVFMEPQRYPIAAVQAEHSFYETDRKVLAQPVRWRKPAGIAGTHFILKPSHFLLKAKCRKCKKPFQLGDRVVAAERRHYDCRRPQD